MSAPCDGPGGHWTADERTGPLTDREVVSAIHDHLADGHDEVVRLTSTLNGRLERQRVHELLDRYMPMAPARVADIGGGPGVHANWLIDQGYEVELLDPVRRHVDQARALGLSAVVGDARRLPWGKGTWTRC